MPHISKHKLQEELLKKIHHEFENALLSRKNRSPDARFLSEIFTDTERLMFAKRLAAVALLHKGVPFHRIEYILKMSPSTIARIKLSLESGRMKRTVEIVSSSGTVNAFLEDLIALFTEGFSRSAKRRSKWMRDNLR